MKCPNCSKEIAEDSQFCEFCGTKIKAKKSKIVWWIIGTIVLLFILLLCILSNPNEFSHDEEKMSVAVSNTLADTRVEIAETTECSTNSNDRLVQQKNASLQQKPKQQPQQISNDEVYVTVENNPKFPGGDVALMQYLSENIKYPVIAQENGTQGRVICQFVVNKDGSIVDINVVRSVDPYLDKEAIRVIKSMPKWTPGTQGGKAVRVKFTLPITFRLQ